MAVSALVFLASLAAWDLSRPPARQATAELLVGAMRVYQATLSPRLAAAGVQCRFQPTCSRYAALSIEKHGAIRGTWRSIARIARCGPWTPAGTQDPP